MYIKRTCPLCSAKTRHNVETFGKDKDIRPLMARPPEETPRKVELMCMDCGDFRTGNLSREERGFED